MPTVNTLFLGVTTSPARDFVGDLAARGNHPAYYLPCVGRCATLAALRGRGVPAERIQASDISLFSSVIGYLADPSRTLADLGIQLLGDNQQFVDGASSATEQAAGVLLAVKYAQVSTAHQYGINVRRELRTRLQHYRGHIQECLEKLLDKIRGIHYDIADVGCVLRFSHCIPSKGLIDRLYTVRVKRVNGQPERARLASLK